MMMIGSMHYRIGILFGLTLVGLRTFVSEWAFLVVSGPIAEMKASASRSQSPPEAPTLKPAQSARNLTGAWLANIWIPPAPEWRLYNAQEMQDIYRGKRIAFAGDSLARRQAMTLFPILNATLSTATKDNMDISVQMVENRYDLELNKYRKDEPCTQYQWNGKHSPKICRQVIVEDDPLLVFNQQSKHDTDNNKTKEKMGSDHQHQIEQGQVWQIWGPCFPDLIDFFEKELNGKTNVTDALDILVVADGIHDVQANTNCHNGAPWVNKTNDYYVELTELLLDRVDTMLQTLEKLQQAKPHLTIVWKTVGYSRNDDADHNKAKLVDRINERSMDILDEYQKHGCFVNVTDDDSMEDTSEAAAAASCIQYIDWGGAVRARSFDPDRIYGDSPNHYGVEARLVGLQMLTNVLAVTQR